MKTINTYYTSNDQLDAFIQKNSIQDSEKLLIQVFTHNNDIDAIAQITTLFASNFPLASLIGATTDGEIKDGNISTQKTVISFTLFENTTLKTYISDQFENYFQAGHDLASTIVTKTTKVIISFIDGLQGNGEEYLKGIAKVDDTITVAGGLAGDNAQFTQTFIFTKEHIYSQGVVGVSLSSSRLHVFTDYSFDWLPVSQKLQITKADKNRVYTINDKTAVDTYSYYLGKDISEQLPSIGIEFPLIMEKNGVQIARAVIGKNDDGSLVFAGNLQKHDEVQFGYGNAEEILNKTQLHIDKLYNLPVESIFLYSCMARRRFLEDEIQNETITYNQIAPTSGFYTYGEFFTAQSQNKELLNQSMTLLALSESDKCNRKKRAVNIEKKESTTIQALSHLIHVSIDELQKKDEIILAQSRNAAMGEMLNMLAHQWRQPLSVIVMTTNNILLDMKLDGLNDTDLENYTNKILEHAANLSQTIDDFRNYFSPSHRQEMILSSLHSDNITLNINHNSDTAIKTYKQHLMQILINLINNSQDAFIDNNEIKKKEIVISTDENDENIMIEICDNAGGIDEAIINEIFNPYFTTKKELNGTGLGLYMSKVIIEKYMRGKITVENDQDGVCFNITIPK